MDTSRAHLLGKAGAPGTASLFEGKAGAPGVADTPSDAAATRRLQQWYETGEGAARIRWGTAGDLTRCHRIAAEHMSSDNAWGFCQRRHQAVLGRSNPESGGSKKDVDLEGLVGPDGKILAGSYEQLTHRLEQEIRETRQRQQDHDPDEKITVVGTYADHVVYSVLAGGVLRSYRAPFRMAEDESSSLALGPPQPVEVEEVVRSRDGDPDVLADVLDGIELATSAAAAGSEEPVDAWGGVYYAAGGEEARARDGKGLEVKAGRVLSAANLGRVRVAVEHLLHVLRAAGIETAPGDPPRTPQTDVQNPDATGQTTSPGTPDGKAYAWLPHDLAALRAAARGERDAPPA